jgi:hypothetical protein
MLALKLNQRMRKWITKKGEAEPHMPGHAITFTGIKVEILQLCSCTSDNLHYEVKNADGSTSIWQHGDLSPLK